MLAILREPIGGGHRMSQSAGDFLPELIASIIDTEPIEVASQPTACHPARTYPYKPNFTWIGLWIGQAAPGKDSGESVSLQGFNGRSNSGTVDDPVAVQSIRPKK